ncbi:hypothetical protein [Hymenobacter sp. BRD67]|uniref:hypothetical protein n=1 Tax=Hymenobacter sp. BRD67 TaxID=2675877 RepID=UPI001564299F|nr:hypothetical protein [Hymenobacter sp. BRD67]QKG55000.1 hypothetical protein GKZ67_21490 [Hymenobacter sp. BRD67]
MQHRFAATVLTLSLLANATAGRAQMVVNDPIHMGVHIGQFARQLREWGETIKNYQVIQDARQIAGVTRDITGEVKNITGQTLMLQQQIQADLRKVQSVKDLRYANPLELFGRAMAMNTSSQPDYMPAIAKAQRLHQALQGRTAPDVETVYQAFSGLDIGRNGAQSFTYHDYKNMREEAFASAYAYEEVLKKKNVETAFNYQKIADEMTTQSIELMATLKNPGRYSMTEAERLRAMGQANDNMIKALQLRQEADRLIQETGKPGPARLAVEGAYRDQLLQNQLLRSISRTGHF